MKDRSVSRLSMLHGAFFLVSGLWPLLHRRSFESVTGPKKEWWLVQTVGLLISSIGVSLLVSSRKKEVPGEMRILAAASSASLTAIDIVHAARRRIKPVYLWDAAAEAILVSGWITRMES